MEKRRLGRTDPPLSNPHNQRRTDPQSEKVNESVFNLSQQIAIKQKSQLEELFDHLQIKRV